jgi:phage shock protein C
VDAVPHERLYRSRTDRVLFGVAGGMADWLDQDPSVVRLVWALLVVFGGAGLLLYIIAAIVIPEEPYEASMAGTQAVTPGAPDTAAPGAAGASRAERRAARRAARGPSSAGIVLGLILILVGGWFLLRDLIPWIDDRLFGPGILVVLGALLIVAALRRDGPPPAG